MKWKKVLIFYLLEKIYICFDISHFSLPLAFAARLPIYARPVAVVLGIRSWPAISTARQSAILVRHRSTIRRARQGAIVIVVVTAAITRAAAINSRHVPNPSVRCRVLCARRHHLRRTRYTSVHTLQIAVTVIVQNQYDHAQIYYQIPVVWNRARYKNCHICRHVDPVVPLQLDHQTMDCAFVGHFML